MNSNGIKKITKLSDELLKNKELADIKEISYSSSFDGREIQGWVAFPPYYDSNKKYRLLVENHGGPISNYGNRFSPEIQLYASNDYIVFYPNPREVQVTEKNLQICCIIITQVKITLM